MKKIQALILSAVLILSLTACGGQADTKANGNSADADVNINSNSTEEFLKTITPETAEAKGVCGADLTWYYQDNVLVIKGTGPMNDYTKGSWHTLAPWGEDTTNELYDKIHWVVFEDGATTIGEYAFYGLDNLDKVTLPNSLISINRSAFDNCDNLKEMTFPASLESIDYDAFCDGAYGEHFDTITFLGDAPEGAREAIDAVNRGGTVYYIGTGFDEYIEWESYSDITWIKQ